VNPLELVFENPGYDIEPLEHVDLQECNKRDTYRFPYAPIGSQGVVVESLYYPQLYSDIYTRKYTGVVLYPCNVDYTYGYPVVGFYWQYAMLKDVPYVP